MAKDNKETLVQDQNPQGGGSFIRNEDGSLSVNQDDPQKQKTADVDAEPISEE